MQSASQAGDASDPTQTEKSSLLTSASDLTHWVVSGTSYCFLYAWHSVVGLASWIASACVVAVSRAGTTTLGAFAWLGSLVHFGLAYLLHFLYLALGFLQFLLLSLLSFFSSSVAYISGFFFLPVAHNQTTTTEDTTQQSNTETTESESLTAWVFSVSPTEAATVAYMTVSGGLQASGSWLWTTWLWLVLSVGEATNTAASCLVWLLASLGLFLWSLLSSLWAGLTYMFFVIGGFLMAAANSTVATSSNVATSVKMVGYDENITLSMWLSYRYLIKAIF